jgi:hypothetical protein
MALSPAAKTERSMGLFGHTRKAEGSIKTPAK